MRRCLVKAKGARTKARRRGREREGFVLETVRWDAGTARLLPRLLKRRACGPVFVTHRRPGTGQGRQPARRVPGHRAGPAVVRAAPRAVDEHAAVRGPGAGWDLHEYRHSSLTHLGEQGASLLMLMVKSRAQEDGECRPLLQAVPGGDR